MWRKYSFPFAHAAGLENQMRTTAVRRLPVAQSGIHEVVTTRPLPVARVDDQFDQWKPRATVDPSHPKSQDFGAW